MAWEWLLWVYLIYYMVLQKAIMLRRIHITLGSLFFKRKKIITHVIKTSKKVMHHIIIYLTYIII